jgi:toxin FitB
LARAVVESPALIDSSGWLEYFADSPRASLFAPVILKVELVIVPTVVLYEVFKRLRNQVGSSIADDAANFMQQGRMYGLDARLALTAATYKLAFADSIIYATAQQHGATLWTQDAHFDGLPGVKYFAKN